MEEAALCWVFGYGSLIWRADFEYGARVPGHILGYERRFWQLSEDHRGVPGQPGRVVTLVPSHDPTLQVWGVAYQLTGNISDIKETIAQLDHREQGGYERTTARFYPKNMASEHSFNVTIYIAKPESPLYSPHFGSIEELAKQVIRSHGPSGRNVEYVFRLAEAVRALNPEAVDLDHHLFELENVVRTLQLEYQER